MFKKAFKVSSNNSISGKDRKKIVADLLKYYDPDSVSTLLEKNNPIITVNKLQGSKIQLYIIDNVPILVDATSKGDYFPTIYAIQQCPNLVQPIEINAGVDSFITGGANLMWPGVKNVKDLGQFKKDDVRYIKTSDNRVIAIGAMACGADELAAKGATGTAMFILHVIDDKLWQSGPKKVLAPLVVEAKKEEAPKAEVAEGKAGEATKEESKTNETKKKEEKKGESEEEEEEEEEEDHDNDDLTQYFGGMIKKKPAAGAGKPAKAKVATQSQPVQAVKKEAVKKEEFDDEDDKKKGGKKGKKGGKGKKEEEEDKKGKKGGKGKKKQESEEEDEDEDEDEDEEGEEKEEAKEATGSQIPTKIMDEYLMEAFLTALKISLNQEDLPMDAGEFQSNHLLACKREGIYIDLKNTSYKKMGKFLQAMSKTGIIEFKESKKGATPQITKVNRNHPKLADFEPVVSKAAKKEAKEEEVSEDDKWPKIEIKEICKIKPQILQFFPEDFNKETYLSFDEVQNVIQKYINQHNLMEKRFVKLDEKLRPLFWVDRPQEEEEEKNEKGEEGEDVKKKKPKAPTYTITKEELFKKLEDYTFKFFEITDLQTKEKETKQGPLKGIHMVAEKSHNKNITKITGLELFKFNINSLVNKFQLRFACSVSTHNYKEKNADKTEVTVHGNFLDQIVDYLTDECKIDKKYITTNDKLGKKKKEKVFGI